MKMKMIQRVMVPGVLALAFLNLGYDCDPGEHEVPANLDEPFQLQVGQVAIFETEPLEIEFVGVTEDSRCPIGLDC